MLEIIDIVISSQTHVLQNLRQQVLIVSWTGAESLREADGNRFPVDYYMYLGWTGIQKAGYQLKFLGDGYASQYIVQHNILMASGNSFCNEK